MNKPPFVVAISTAVIAAVVITFFILFGIQPNHPRSTIVAVIFAFNTLLICVLGARFLLKYRALQGGRIFGRRGGLTQRFVFRFSVAAIVPASIVALLLVSNVLRGIDNWFSERVENSINRAVTIEKNNLDGLITSLDQQFQAMTVDINNAKGGFDAEPDLFQTYLERQTEARNFNAAWIVDRSNRVFVKTENSGAFSLPELTDSTFDEADNGVTAKTFFEEAGMVTGLTQLKGFGDSVYLLAMASIDPQYIENLRSLEVAYLDLVNARGSAQDLYVIFGIGYGQIALLLLILGAQLILQAAQSVTSPIKALAKAAHSVRKGNLEARVPLPETRDEVRTLSRSFNAMTGQLSEQQAALFAAKDELSERNKFLETLLAAINVGVIRIDGSGDIISVNPSTLFLMGWQTPPLGRSIGEAAPVFAQAAAYTLKTGKVYDETIEYKKPKDTIYLRVKTASDAVGGCIITIEDITRQIRAQRQSAWRDVARRIAHEIRNPLTPIQLSAERLERRFGERDGIKDDPVFEKCIATILRQVDELGRLVKNFSSFATMPKPQREEFNLSKLLEDVVFAHVISFPELDFTFDKPKSNMIYLGDDRLLGQVFGNILTNAAQAIRLDIEENPSEKMGKVTVSVAMSQDKPGFKIYFDDNGPGFPEDDREALFEPYVTTSPQGTGLGLSIARRAVADHGGWISLDKNDTVKSGARVTVFLPTEQIVDGQKSA